MKTHWFKRISIILTALFLLLALYVPAMAQKGTGRKSATPSNMEEEIEDMKEEEPEDEEDPDGYFDDGNALPDLQEEEDRVVVSESRSSEEELPDAEEGLKAGADALAETKAAAATLPETGEKVTVKDFAGTWTIDGITSYRFREDGTGALILPEHTYTFRYTLEEGRLALKFENAKAGRAVFTAALENGRLILVKEEEAGTAEFLLEKISE